MKVRLSVWMLLLCLTGALSGCTGSRDAKENDTQNRSALQPAMVRAMDALDLVVAKVGAGDAAGARESYQTFAAAFGEVLGPVSLKDPLLAQRMANANTAIKGALAAAKPVGGIIGREATTITATMHQAAEAMGVPLVARASSAVETGPVAQMPTRTIEVRAKEYRFTPDQVQVEKGTKVTVRLINDGTMKHEWELDAFGVEIKPIPPGTSQEITFTADKTGTFEYACHVDGHYEKGMRGLLIVK